MIFCVFSYNRGAWLSNCVQSIEGLSPQAEIRIFDDGSDDSDTLKTLSRLEERHRVWRVSRQGGGKHGGLYANMQEALEHCADAPLICFLQDDMQVVRPLAPEDCKNFERYFQRFPGAGFLQPCFLKGSDRRREQAQLTFDGDRGVYFRRDNGQSAGIHYSDTLIANPARLLGAGWRFAPSERGNERQARGLFDPMGQVFAPFAMWLPEVPAYRGKRKTLALRLAERKRPSGFHPFRPLDESEARSLKSRPADKLPFAEDFLQLAAPGPPGPWRYHPLQGHRWLKKLNSYELFLRAGLRAPSRQR